MRSLENKNRELQINIDEFRVKTSYITKDYANYFSIIRDLKAEVPLTLRFAAHKNEEEKASWF